MIRSGNILYAICAVAAAVPVAAAAQAAGDDLLRDRLRACSTIAEIEARVGCYDALAAEGPAEARPSAPAESPAPVAAFGREQLPRTADTPREQVERIIATVSSAVERQPGIYLLTLEGGAQWQFVEGVPAIYDPPRRGSTVEMRSASFGGYVLHFKNQQAVRVRRVS